MAKTPEGKVKDEVKAYLISLGKDCWFYMPVPMGYGKVGVMDFIVCYKGFFLGPETKKKGGKSEPWQEREQQAVNKAGGSAGRITDLELLKSWVAECDEKYDCLGRAGLINAL